jgi:hypothetical protein
MSQEDKESSGATGWSRGPEATNLMAGMTVRCLSFSSRLFFFRFPFACDFGMDWLIQWSFCDFSFILLFFFNEFPR